MNHLSLLDKTFKANMEVKTMFKIKSIFEPSEEEDGFRILIDKFWPEGLKKETKVDLWLKEITPTRDIDEWPEDDPERFEKFKEQYRQELRGKKTLIKIVRDFEQKQGIVTFLHCAKHPDHNAAAILRDKLSGYRIIVHSSRSS